MVIPFDPQSWTTRTAMKFGEALQLDGEDVVSFVGAGGKKTAMSRLVAEADHRRIGVTTTTHMPPPDDLPLVLSSPDRLGAELRSSPGSIAFARERVTNPARAHEKVRGFEPSVIDGLVETPRFEWLLVKADGARRRSFKAPGDAEPAIPASSTIVVVFASVAVVGSPLTSTFVHRPERVAELGDTSIGERVSPEVIARVLASETGGLKDIPPSSRAIVVLNQADTSEQRRVARSILDDVLHATDRYDLGLVTSFRHAMLDAVDA